MKACVLSAPHPVETSPLLYRDVPNPQADGSQVLIRIRACGTVGPICTSSRATFLRANLQSFPVIRLSAQSKQGRALNSISSWDSRWSAVAASNLRRLRLLLSGGRKSLRKRRIHRLYRGWRLCGIPGSSGRHSYMSCLTI